MQWLGNTGSVMGGLRMQWLGNTGCVCLQVLETVENEEVKTQVHVFSEHKEEDAEEFSHRYDNIRIEMEYPLSVTVKYKRAKCC